MQLPSGVGDVIARIGRIESALPSVRSQTPVRTLSTNEFDPFGAAYEQAVAASRGTPATSVADTAPTSRAVATRLPERFSVDSVGSRPMSSSYSPTPPVHAAPGTRRIGGYGSMPVPPELSAIGNGQIGADRLQPLAQSGHRLYAPAAAAWDGLVAAAASEGLELRITDSYRTYDQQVDLAARKGLYSQGGLAAKPGTSNHGWGLAVDADVRDPSMLEWLRVNGPRFGFVEAVPREPWHWEYRPHQV